MVLLRSDAALENAHGPEFPSPLLRVHDPESGQFGGVDWFEGVASDPLTLHKYAYGHDDPVNNIDPSGMFSTLGTLVATTIGVSSVGFLGSMLASKFFGDSGSLGGLVGSHYTMRAFLNAMWFPQLLTRTDFMLTRSGTEAHIGDTGLAKDNTKLFRYTWIVDYAHKRGVPADGNWHNVEVADFVDTYAGHRGQKPQINSFWVGRLSALKARGNYEVKLEGTGDARFRNVGLEWIAEDYTDAHSFHEGLSEEWDWTDARAAVNYFLEGYVDLVGDKGLGADFWLFIHFYDEAASPQLSYPHRTEWN